MTARRFKIEKVGDDFVPVQQGEEASTSNASFNADNANYWLWGAALTLAGLRHRKLLGLAMMGAGGCMLYQAATGKKALPEISKWMASYGLSNPFSDDDTPGPSYQHDFKNKASQSPEDEVDEMSMESFPASDPPARTSVASA